MKKWYERIVQLHYPNEYVMICKSVQKDAAIQDWLHVGMEI